MNRGARFYRALSFLWLGLLIGAIALFTLGARAQAAIALAAVLVVIAFQTFTFRCNACGARPGAWLLAVWTLLLDYELYIADALLLRRCPRCDRDFKQLERAPSGAEPRPHG